MKDWQYYFKNPHEGVGTTYERFVLHDYFKRLKEQHEIRSVLEAPVFGMTGIPGINSLWWARYGVGVTLVDHNKERLRRIEKVWHELSLTAYLVCDSGAYSSLPFHNRVFDLSWNFAALNQCLIPELLLKELIRVTRKVIFVCIPNQLSLFMPIRRVLVGDRGLSTDPKLASFDLEAFMKASQWDLKEKGFLDVPPWPDIAMSKEDLLRKMGLGPDARRLEARITSKNRICILDYYSSKDRDMKHRMHRYGFLENSPQWFKRFWAHHEYFVFIR